MSAERETLADRINNLEDRLTALEVHAQRLGAQVTTLEERYVEDHDTLTRVHQNTIAILSRLRTEANRTLKPL